MTLPALPGHYATGDVPLAAEVNSIIDNVAETVNEMHSHALGSFTLGSTFSITSATVVDMGMAATVALIAGQVVRLSYSGQLIYGSALNTLDANLCVIEFHEGATNVSVGNEVQWRALGTGGTGQEKCVWPDGVPGRG